jgi:AcrR family transcriptional regulator
VLLYSVVRSNDPLSPPPEPSPGRSDSNAIVDAILAAAIELGDDPSLTAIATRAGVGIASLYRYFPSKHSIYAEVSRRQQRESLVRLRAVLTDTSLSLDEAIYACCRVALEAPGVSERLRRRINLSLPVSWSGDTAEAVFSGAIQEMTEALRVRMNPAPENLQARVFAMFSAARGMVLMSRLMPSLAPNDETLLQLMVQGSHAYLNDS